MRFSFQDAPDLTFVVYSLEAAAANPETLSQAAIIDNLDPVEAARLDKVRNIGIAVSTTPVNPALSSAKSNEGISYRPISTVVRPL